MCANEAVHNLIQSVEMLQAEWGNDDVYNSRQSLDPPNENAECNNLDTTIMNVGAGMNCRRRRAEHLKYMHQK